MTIIETERLILRAWQEKDAAPYWRINQDPKVTEHLPGPMTREQVVERIGMTRDMQGDFAHPMLLPDHRLSKHVLYRVEKP